MKVSLISTDDFSGSLGIRSISAFLKKRGHDVKLVFMVPRERVDYTLPVLFAGALRELVDLVADSEVIGISSMAFEAGTCVTIINHLKKINRPIVWGGIHATSCPEECIKYADAVCLGEGEEAFCELVEAIEKKEDFSNIRNFWFNRGGQIIKNPVRPLLQDLDSLPTPDYNAESHFINEGQFLVNAGPWYRRISRVLVHSTRGCPNTCTYCINSFLKGLYLGKGKFMRSRSIGTIIDELSYYRSIMPNLKSVFFTDDTMFARSHEELSLFAKAYKNKIGLPFVCYTSPNTCREDKLKALLEGGLHRLQMGIQTGSERINREIYERNIPNDSVIRSTRIISKYKRQMAPPDYHIIFCNPYENEKDITDTVSLLHKLPTPFILTAFQLGLLPASALCKRAQRDGLLNGDTLFNFCNYVKALAFNSRQRYLNFIIYLMNGKASKLRLGSIPRFMIIFLIDDRIINYFKAHKIQLSVLMGLARMLGRAKDFVSGSILFFKQKCKSFIIK